MYTIGTVEFESLVDLIQYYEQNPLYKKIKLMYPVNEDVVRRVGTASVFYFFPYYFVDYFFLFLIIVFFYHNGCFFFLKEIYQFIYVYFCLCLRFVL